MSVYLTSTTTYRASLGEKFWKGLLTPWKCILFGEVNRLDSHGTELYNLVLPLSEEVKRAATEASRILRVVRMAQIPAFCSKRTVKIQKPISAATQTFQGAKKDSERLQKPVCNIFALRSAPLSVEAFLKALSSLRLPLPHYLFYPLAPYSLSLDMLSPAYLGPRRGSVQRKLQRDSGDHLNDLWRIRWCEQ